MTAKMQYLYQASITGEWTDEELRRAGIVYREPFEDGLWLVELDQSAEAQLLESDIYQRDINGTRSILIELP